MMNIRTLFVFTCCLIIFSTQSMARSVLSVPSGSYPTIQSAINAALDGDTVQVAAGTYFENIDLLGKAIIVESSTGANTTIIDGQSSGSVIKCRSGETRATIIRGFTIQNGTGTNIGLPNGGNSGGGILNQASSPTISDCIIRQNNSRHGGGMGNFDGAAPLVEDCVFINNTTTGSPNAYGAGMANWPGSNPEVLRCTFEDNIAQGVFGAFGGGMYNRTSSPIVTLCVFRNNQALMGSVEGRGGGFDNAFGGSSPIVLNCLFEGNFASTLGGGINNNTGVADNPQYINCTIRDNSSNGQGGGVVTGAASDYINTIVWGNVAPSSPEILSGAGTLSSFAFCDIAGSGGSGATWVFSTGIDLGGNIDADPLFALSRLTTYSPCIDAADSTPLIDANLLTDLDGNIRFSNHPRFDTGTGSFSFTDMGAFEFDGSSACTICNADISLDGNVNVTDLLLLLAAWGVCP